MRTVIMLAALIAGPGAVDSGVPQPADGKVAVAPVGRNLIRLIGGYEAGGAPGSFTQVIDGESGNYRLDITTGPANEQSGFDGAPWLRHDRILVPIDLPGAVADARARVFVLRQGWRDRAMARFMRSLGREARAGGTVDRVAAEIPGASPVELWIDRGTTRLVRAVVAADGGPLEMRFADWRTVGNTVIPFRREERDATGQTTVFTVRTAAVSGEGAAALARPLSEPHGALVLPTKTAHFVLDHGERGHIVVAVHLNGRSARLIFDTGAANYFTPEAARRYLLSVGGGLNIGGVGATSMAGGFTRAGRLTIGPATLIDTVAMVAPLPRAATHPRPGLIIEGLTGFEFLAQFRTTIDYGRRTLGFSSFDRPLPVGVAVPFRTDGSGIYVEATVEGHRGWFRLDTGDGGSVTLFRRFAETSGLAVGGTRRVVSAEVGGDVASRARRLRSVEIAGFTLRDIDAEVSEQQAGAFASRSVAGNIGAGLLSRFQIVIDFRSRRLVFAPSPRPCQRLVRPRPTDRPTRR